MILCVPHILQGVKGALGDPGLPGPTGVRGEFGERVSLTYVTVITVLHTVLHSTTHCDEERHSVYCYLLLYNDLVISHKIKP